MCMAKLRPAILALAASKGWRQPADPRAITPELQSRLNATAVNPGSTEPNYVTQVGPGVTGGGGFGGASPASLGRAFSSAASSIGRIV